MDVPHDLRSAADMMAVTQLILKERESRDLGNWDDLNDCFHADSQVRVSWFRGSGADFVKGSIDMARRNVLARHRLSPIRVALSGDRAIATLSAIIDIPARPQGVEMTLSVYSRFVYRAERRGNAWRVLSFDAVYQRDELAPAIPGRTITLDPRDLQSFRPSYRLLAYILSQQGYAIDPDLPGEDRPQSVRDLMRDVHRWAGLEPE